MGADFYENSDIRDKKKEEGSLPVGIGAGSTIRRAIIDKNARIGSNVTITNKDNVQEASREELGYMIRSGIVVVLKGAVIPDNTVTVSYTHLTLPTIYSV